MYADYLLNNYGQFLIVVFPFIVIFCFVKFTPVKQPFIVVGLASIIISPVYPLSIGGIFDIYELLPAFIISCIAIVIVSLLTKAPSEEITGNPIAKASTMALQHPSFCVGITNTSAQFKY